MFLTKAEQKKLSKLGLYAKSGNETRGEWDLFLKKRWFPFFRRSSKPIATISRSFYCCFGTTPGTLEPFFSYCVIYYTFEKGEKIDNFRMLDTLEEVFDFLNYMLKKNNKCKLNTE